MDPRAEGLLSEFLDEWKEDRREGRTVRALHERFDDHEKLDEQRFGAIGRRQSAADLERARQDGIAEGTGRFKTVPTKHPSLPPWARSPVAQGVSKGVAVLAVGLAGWLLNELRDHTPVRGPVPTYAATAAAPASPVPYPQGPIPPEK